jgi:toxin ParE1/3/4
MYSIRFTEQADLDLLNIYIYTHNNWGEPQANRYTDSLRDAIYKIATEPERIGTVDRSYLRPGYRSYHQQRHLIFYRVEDNYVEVIRFLHDSMDIATHFPNDV